MKAITVLPGAPNSVQLDDRPEPPADSATLLGNLLASGSVNANWTHYRRAAEALARADRTWLTGMITRRVPLARWREAFENRRDDIKVVLQFAEAPA